jgi:hypothetical protein
MLSPVKDSGKYTYPAMPLTTKELGASGESPKAADVGANNSPIILSLLI